MLPSKFSTIAIYAGQRAVATATKPPAIPAYRLGLEFFGCFGNDPAKHRDFSAVTHAARTKGIPPFLIPHVAEHPDTSATAQPLGNAIKEAGMPVTVVGAKEMRASGTTVAPRNRSF